jgi:hypothetical protein
MAGSSQCEKMQAALQTHRAGLVKLRDGTRSFKLLKKIDGALREIDRSELEIGRVPDGKVISDEEFKKLREDWTGVVKNAQEVDEENARKRWCYGIVWFCIFTGFFLASVAVYVYFHWKYPSDDKEIFLWTTGPLSYVEVAAWTLFGLLTWLLYNLQHYNRLGKDIRLWVQWYWSKVFQGVLIGLVVVVAIKQIDFGATFTGSIVPVIAGFILGYYSDRARDYLDLIRDKVLPGTRAPSVTLRPPELVSASQVYVHGTVEGPPETRGSLTVGSAQPVPVAIDDSGNFGIMAEVKEVPTFIKFEATSPAKRIGSATACVAAAEEKPGTPGPAEAKPGTAEPVETRPETTEATEAKPVTAGAAKDMQDKAEASQPPAGDAVKS